MTTLLLLAAMQTQPAAPTSRPGPPAHDPHTPGYVQATELPDKELPSPTANGNFIVGPTHVKAPEFTPAADVPKGKIITFTMESKDSKTYPGIAREKNTSGTPDPANPASLIVTTSHPAPYSRKVTVYVPQQYKPGDEAPFIVGADGPDTKLFTALDSLIAAKKVPVQVAVSISNGSGDAQGSQRGLEYDTLSATYAEFVETEVLPLVEKNADVKLTKDPERRATIGCSSGATCAFTMAWYRPDLYRRVISYSGTYVNQQWPHNPALPGGAWEYHRTLIPNTDRKPIRIWMHVSESDLFNPNSMRDDMHDWVVANEHMAAALAAKGYAYQFVFTRNSRHCDGAVKDQTYPLALEYIWSDLPR